MAEFDIFADQLWEESKRFLERAVATEDKIGKEANLHAALMLSFCALEARLNSLCEESALRTDLSEHEEAFILEREVRLESGRFNHLTPEGWQTGNTWWFSNLEGLQKEPPADRVLTVIERTYHASAYSPESVTFRETWRISDGDDRIRELKMQFSPQGSC